VQNLKKSFFMIGPARIAMYTCVVGFSLGLAAGSNIVPNPSFETVGPNGNSTTFTGLGGGGPSAAANWLIFNNSNTTTTTELCPGGPNCAGAPSPIDGSEVMHIVTGGLNSGIFTTFPANNGPVIESLWVYVVSGQAGMGAGNGANTVFEASTAITGSWVLLSNPNIANPSPISEYIIYSKAGGANFFVDVAGVNPVPEPGTFALAGFAGLLMIAIVRARSRA
jgi:hypothetical protein